MNIGRLYLAVLEIRRQNAGDSIVIDRNLGDRMHSIKDSDGIFSDFNGRLYIVGNGEEIHATKKQKNSPPIFL